MQAATIVRTILLIAAVAATVSACGRRPTSLMTPYEAAIEAREEAEDNDEKLPPAPEPPVEDRRFFLDGLI
jgi:hypothetical protein